MRRYAIAALLLMIATAVPSLAQRRGGPVRTLSGFSPAHRAHFPHSFYLGTPLWADDYLPNDSGSASVIVVQTPPPAAAVSPDPVFDAPKPAAPLLIEWQGDRYVRRTGPSAGESTAAPLDYALPAKTNSAANPAHSLTPLTSALSSRDDRIVHAEPAPATFIFRDGHREQSSDYTIVQGTIYARGDYWTSGSWSKKIPIVQLDVPATLRANAENGVPFRLPSAPNEIITRP